MPPDSQAADTQDFDAQEKSHVLVPFAVCENPASCQVLRHLDLPNLDALLQSLLPQGVQSIPPQSPALAHERLWAGAHKLNPLAPAWAAWHAERMGLDPLGQWAWAWITPCYWQVAQAQVTLSDPNELQLSAPELQALLESMQPYFAEDGIELMQVEHPPKLPPPLLPPMPTSWLAKGEVFRSSDVFSSTYVSLERALDQDLTPWMPAHPTLRRLQNEMQMLMYTHPVNEARSQARRPTVNSFWISGAGAVDGTSTSNPFPSRASMQYVQDLSRPALQGELQGDWRAWSEAWRALDAQTLAPLLAKVRSAQADTSEPHAPHRQISLTLCSAFKSHTFSSGNVSAWSRFKRVFQPSATARRHAFMEQL